MEYGGSARPMRPLRYWLMVPENLPVPDKWRNGIFENFAKHFCDSIDGPVDFRLYGSW
jgi:hypothetical protein